eukprot:2997800-Prymnesium_polylepis.1
MHGRAYRALGPISRRRILPLQLLPRLPTDGVTRGHGHTLARGRVGDPHGGRGRGRAARAYRADW